MARDRANIFTSIWTDTDWRELPRDEQWLYFALMTHPELNYAGVCDWRPGRLAKSAGDTSRAEIERIGAALQAKRFILVDEETEEVLVRSWIRHDGLLKHPKTCISFFNAYGSTSSPDIRKVIIHELKRLHAEDPTLKAFEFEKVVGLLRQPAAPIEDVTLGSTPPLPMPQEQAQPMAEPSPQPSGQPLGYGLDQPLTQPSAQPVPTATATTTSPPNGGEGGAGGELATRPDPAPTDHDAPPKAKRGTRLPEGWEPPADVVQAMAVECPQIDQQAEYRSFVDHWRSQPGEKGIKVDWTATYRNWIRRAVKYAPRNTTGNRHIDRAINAWGTLHTPTTHDTAVIDDPWTPKEIRA